MNTKSGKPIVIVDMDGTLAHVAHRLHHIKAPGRKNWRAFFEGMDSDPLNEDIAAMVRRLAPDHEILIVTGRPDTYRRRTESWLRKHQVPFHQIYMRRSGDHRPDTVVKKEILDSLGSRKEFVELVIDDRPSVCDMWRDCGLNVHQVITGETY